MKVNDNKNTKTYTQVNKGSFVKRTKGIGNGQNSIVKGDILKAEIIDVKHNSIIIKLLNGQTVDAKVTDQFNFFIGQNLSFVVKDASIGQFLLKPIIEEGAMTTNKLVQILENAGLPTSSENTRIITKLIENNMPVDKATLNKIMPFVKQGTDISQLNFLYKNNISINKENIQQLDLMQKGESKIIQNIAALSDDLANLTNDEIKNALTRLIIKDNPISKETFNQLQQYNAVRSNEVLGQMNDKSSFIEMPLGNILSEKEIRLLEYEVNAALGNKEPIFQLHNKTINEVFEGVKTVSTDLEKKIQNLLAKRVSYSLISKEIIMNKEHLVSPKKVNEFYNKLYDKVLDLLKFEDLQSTATEVAKEAKHIKHSIEFMNEFNNNFHFIQMPILMADKLLNSELYVYNNKRQIKNNNGTFTALLRLDLVNLGHLDIYVAKTEKNVECKFYTDNDEKSNKIMDDIHKLHNSLRKAGFNITGMKVIKREKTFNVIEDFFDGKKEVQEIKRYSFDMRV